MRVRSRPPDRSPLQPRASAAGPARPFAAPPRSEAVQPAPELDRVARLGHRFRSPTSADLAPSGAGRPLPAAMRGKMESAFGEDFSTVRVHQDAKAASIRAVAYTRGEDIHFRPGRFQTAGRAGEELLAHELAHVVQQRQGRVAAPPAEAPVQEVPELEGEARQAGQVAARGGRVAAGGGGRSATGTPAAGEPAAQRDPDDDDELFNQWNYFVPDTTAAFGHPGVRKKGELVPYKGATSHGLSNIPVKLYDSSSRSSASSVLGKNALDVINSSTWRNSDEAGMDVVKSWTGYQSQHIIPYQHHSHPLLKKLDVNTEFPTNNQFLPEPRTTERWGGSASTVFPHSFYSNPGKGHTTGAPHLGFHSWYNKYVGKQLSAIENDVSANSKSDAVREFELYKLQRALRIGQETGLPFYPTQTFSVGRRTFIGQDVPTSYDPSLGGGSPRLDLELVGDAYSSGKKDKANRKLEEVWQKTLKTLPRSKDHLPVGLR